MPKNKIKYFGCHCNLQSNIPFLSENFHNLPTKKSKRNVLVKFSNYKRQINYKLLSNNKMSVIKRLINYYANDTHARMKILKMYCKKSHIIVGKYVNLYSLTNFSTDKLKLYSSCAKIYCFSN